MGWHCATRKNFDGDTRSIRHTLRGCSLVYFCCCVAAVGVVAAVVAAVVVAAVVAAVVVVAAAVVVVAVVVGNKLGGLVPSAAFSIIGGTREGGGQIGP